MEQTGGMLCPFQVEEQTVLQRSPKKQPHRPTGYMEKKILKVLLPTDRYMQVSIVVIVLHSKSSAWYYIVFPLRPSDHRLWSTKHLANQHCRLTFGNLGYRRKGVDKTWWLRYTISQHTIYTLATFFTTDFCNHQRTAWWLQRGDQCPALWNSSTGTRLLATHAAVTHTMHTLLSVLSVCHKCRCTSTKMFPMI